MEDGRTLAGVGLLKGLEADALDKLQSECRWRALESGAEVVAADTGSTDVYFVTAGRVRVTFYSATGREVSFRDLRAGDSFGELAAIDGQSRSASVVALENCTVGAISREQFWHLLRTSPEVSANLLRSLAALVRDLSSRIVDTTVLTVPQRVRAEIVRLARVTRPKGKSVLIPKSPTHAELASQIGATREAVSRELSRMANEGLVERRGRDLLVRDIERLQSSIETMRDG